METSTHSKPPKAKTHANRVNLIFILLFLMPLICKTKGNSPHTPKQLTWQVLSQTGDIIWSITGSYPPNTWWPHLYPKICDLMTGLETWDIPSLT